MPGIFGAVSAAPRRAAAVPLEDVSSALRVQPRLRVRVARADDGRAVLGAVDLGVLPGSGVPHRDADGSLAVVHGEITNLGGGDPAAALLARWREDPTTLERLEGSFVAALWDAPAGRLLLVNDRFGLRNCYWALAGGVLVFAPQVGPLLGLAGVDATPDAAAAADLLAFEHVLGPRTLARGVHALPPASIARFDADGFSVTRYWAPRYRARPGTLEEHAAELDRRLRAAVERAFGGTARPGLPISVGLDSRAILAALGAERAREVPCFTYGIPGSADWVGGARLAAAVGAPHHALELVPGYIAARFREMVALTDGMQLALNAHAAVLQDCAPHCELIVLGNGGDCALDRLWWWRDDDAEGEAFVARMFQRLNLGVTPAMAPQVLRGELLRELLDGARARLAERLRLYEGDCAADVADAYNVGERHWRWVLQGVPAQSGHVEFRQPFYDYRVVDLALEAPSAFREGRRLHVAMIARRAPELRPARRHDSRLLRRIARYRKRAMARLETAWRRVAGPSDRPRLGGFADYDWELRTGSRSVIDELVVAERTLARGWYRPEGLRALAEAHLAGRGNHARTLGMIATLEHWLRTLEDRQESAADPAAIRRVAD